MELSTILFGINSKEVKRFSSHDGDILTDNSIYRILRRHCRPEQ